MGEKGGYRSEEKEKQKILTLALNSASARLRCWWNTRSRVSRSRGELNPGELFVWDEGGRAPLRESSSCLQWPDL